MVKQNSTKTKLKKVSTQESEPIKKEKFLLRSIPVYLFILINLIIICGLSLFFYYFPQNASTTTYTTSSEPLDANVKVYRENNGSLVNPILFVEIESKEALNPIKEKINNYLDQKKQLGNLTSASVYLKDLNAGVFMDINHDSLYDPASLMKVPLLLIYLKQAESNPQILKQTFLFSQKTSDATIATIKDQTLTVGKSYTVQELLRFMIVYSDNEAFWILYNNINQNFFKELDNKLTIPSNYDVIHYSRKDEHFVANVNSVARYFMVLYNASYLNKTWSTYALNLLTEANFNEGLLKGIDTNVAVAHKFGERTISYWAGNKLENLQTEFHEYGIVYLKNRPYLLGVMTRGHETKALQAVVVDISKMVFDEFKGK